MPKIERRGLRALAPSPAFQQTPEVPAPSVPAPPIPDDLERYAKVRAAREPEFEVKFAGASVRAEGRALLDEEPVVRDDRQYARGDSWAFLEADRLVVVKFPVEFPVVELAGVTVAARVFAERGGEFPFWAEFTHPLDGRTRSVILGKSWIQT